MGLLDQVIGGVLGQVLGGGRGHPQGGGMGGGGGMGSGMGGAVSPIVQALLMLLMQKGMSGGLGDIFGGGGRQTPQHEPSVGRDDSDLGGFGQDRQRGGQRDEGGGFGDLAGMLDGPGGPSSNPRGNDSGAGPYSGLDREPGDSQGGLDGLIDRFQRGGLGDVMESWIGTGQNHPVEPNRLGEALGPQTVDSLASQTGLDRNTLLSQLAQALPGVIDGLTPQGRRPTPEDQRGW
ncbi:YidB family protein [uncultured Methylobacterium sp.]|uniref:YidB family protein n=1 Tax=uncultured Methylobacterium sp. TaxID=157278 RepID=UPI0035CAAF4C